MVKVYTEKEEILAAKQQITEEMNNFLTDFYTVDNHKYTVGNIYITKEFDRLTNSMHISFNIDWIEDKNAD